MWAACSDEEGYTSSNGGDNVPGFLESCLLVSQAKECGGNNNCSLLQEGRWCGLVGAMKVGKVEEYWLRGVVEGGTCWFWGSLDVDVQ